MDLRSDVRLDLLRGLRRKEAAKPSLGLFLVAIAQGLDGVACEKTGLLALSSALIFTFISCDSRPVEPFSVATMAPCCAQLAIIIVAKPTEKYLS